MAILLVTINKANANFSDFIEQQINGNFSAIHTINMLCLSTFCSNRNTIDFKIKAQNSFMSLTPSNIGPQASLKHLRNYSL